MPGKQRVVVAVPEELVKLSKTERDELKKLFQTELARVVTGKESETAFAVSLQNTKPQAPSSEALSAKSPTAGRSRKAAKGGSRKTRR